MDEEKNSQIESQDQSETVTTIVEPAAPLPPEKTKKRWVKPSKKILIIGAVVLLIGAGAAAFWLTKKDKKVAQNSTPTAATNDTTAPTDQTTPNANLKDLETITVDGNTYFSTPKKLENLNFFKTFSQFGQSCDNDGKNCKDDLASNDISYYQVGTTKAGKAIIQTYVASQRGDMGGGASYIATETAPKIYTVIAQNSGLLNPDAQGKVDETYANDAAKGFSSNVTLDLKTKLSELSFPSELTIANQKIKSNYGNASPYFLPGGLTDIRGPYFGTATDPNSLKKIGTSGNLTLYELAYKTTDNYKIMELYVVFGNLYAIPYVPNGELASTTDKLPITWTTGATDAIAAYSGGAGCGSIGYVTTVTAPAGLKQVGTTKAGQKIYQLPSSDALVQELYTEDYKPNANDTYLDASLRNLTIDQFTDKHAYFIVQNGLNEYVVFQRDDMFIRGGCGKPVIYLYPTTPTSVSVLVDADIVLSTPTYEKNGWQNVFAQPNGTLSYRGSTYDSLYWEGYGHGLYPAVTAGSVVQRSDAVLTIQNQLKAQGFNAKETADFLAYWQPKLPQSPYIRLTWFGTSVMNQLAPLTISPRPTTVIRTFLDFEGLDQPVSLPAQTFSAPKRNGFTVTEWGGLLRDGIR